MAFILRVSACQTRKLDWQILLRPRFYFDRPTKFPPKKISSSRDRVGIHRAQEKRRLLVSRTQLDIQTVLK
jgi:hypothetical protein